MRKTAYKAGKTIFKEGERGCNAYIIVDGEIEISRQAKDGSVIVLGKLSENQMFGEVSLIDETIPRTVTVKAITDVVVAVVPKESLAEKLMSTPAPVKSILKVTAKRISESYDMLIDLHSRISEMVRMKVGEVMEKNEELENKVQFQEEKIEELKQEIEQLKVAGPARKEKAAAQSQKLDKDRSMKLSLKDLDKMAQQQKQKNQ